MPTRLCVLRLTVVLTALAFLIGGTGTVRAELVLAEMLADPASDWNGDGEVQFRDDEWIEVANTGPDPVDLADYYIRDALGEEPHLNLTGVLAPGEVAVFYGSDAVSWQQANGMSITGFSLNNGGDTVELLYLEPGQTEAVRVDIYIYLEHETVDDRASGRLPATGAWALFDALNPYNGDTPPLSTGCQPTPGVLNDCIPNVPNQPATWGHVKVDYR